MLLFLTEGCITPLVVISHYISHHAFWEHSLIKSRGWPKSLISPWLWSLNVKDKEPSCFKAWNVNFKMTLEGLLTKTNMCQRIIIKLYSSFLFNNPTLFLFLVYLITEISKSTAKILCNLAELSFQMSFL